MDWKSCAGNIGDEILEAEKLNVNAEETYETHTFSTGCGAMYTLVCC